MVRQMLRRSVVVALGLAALVFTVFSAAPTQVGAVDEFTIVGCNYGDFQCLYAHNGIDPNAPQIDVSALRNPYYYGYGYGYQTYAYSQPYYGYGYNPYGYGYNPYGYGYYGYGYNPYYYTNVYTGSPQSQADLAHVTGYCNIGYGQQCGYPTR